MKSFKNWKWIQFIPIVILVLFITSCYPGSAFENDEFDVAVTLYDEKIDFTQNKTFAMPDTVMEIGEGNVALTGQHDNTVLQLIRTNMADLGYTEIPDFSGTKPDIVVMASKTSSTNIEVYNSYPYWWDYWGYYPYWPIYGGIGPGYSPYYPWGGTQVYSYSTGTLFIEMINPNDQSMPDRIPTIWAGAINGILDGNFQQTQNRITENINQLFIQSPYLNVQ